MARTFESKAVRVLERSDSVRTTVPAPIAALLGIGPGDTLVWEVKLDSGEVSVSRKDGTATSESAPGSGPQSKASKRR
jgi:bifunctional DNA-binding transcriptional regulator/antitoxin component of YhaV-PrlF toxin-antitoxin module